jgi:hypothetical protein
MTPHDNLQLHRTVGDTDPFLMQLLVRSTANAAGVPVPDAATVVMHVSDGSTVYEIPGQAEGGDEGRFAFPTNAIAGVEEGRLTYEIEVTDGGSEYTVANGTIYQRPQIA